MQPIDRAAQEREAWQRFTEDLSQQLAALWPAMPQRLGERYPAFVDLAVEQALSLGLLHTAGVARYLNLVFVWGPGFQDKPGFEWASALLAPRAAESELSPDQAWPPRWLRLHQLLQRSLLELQHLAGTRIEPASLSRSDAHLLERFGGLGLRGQLCRYRDASTSAAPPRLACDLQALELRLLPAATPEQGLRQYVLPVVTEAIAAGDGAVDWQLQPLSPPPPLRASAAQPLPAVLHLLTPLQGQGEPARLQLRSHFHAQCDSDRHPAVDLLGAHGRWTWAGHETRAFNWPLQGREQTQQPAGPGTRIAEETSPEFHLLQVEVCGLRDAGDPAELMGSQQKRLAVYPAAQWWVEMQRAKPLAQDLLAGGQLRRWNAGASRARVERDGCIQNPAALCRQFSEGLDAAIASGLQGLAQAWQALPGLAEPRCEVLLGVLLGRMSCSWGWAYGPAGMAAPPLLRLQAQLALDACLAELSLGGVLQLGETRSRLQLQLQGREPLRQQLLRDNAQPPLIEAMQPLRRSWRLPFTLQLEPLALDAPGLLQLARPLSGALVGEAGLRPASRGGSGFEWFAALRIEPVLADLQIDDALLGSRRQQLQLLPALQLLDWSMA